MIELSGHLAGPITIEEDSILTGMISGDVEITKNAHLLVTGMIVGRVDVSMQSGLSVTGMINGTIANSGKLQLSGTLNGTIIDLGGEQNIEPGAVINSLNLF